MTLRYFLYLLIILISAIQGAIYFKRLRTEFRLLTLLLGITLLCELTGRFFAAYIRTSFPAYHILIPVQFLLYPLIYIHFNEANARVSRVIKICAVVLAFLSIANSIFIQPVLIFPSNGVLLLSLLVITLALYTYNNMIMNPSSRKLVKEPLFWFNTGNLVFYTITFLIFAFFSPLRKLGIIVQEWEYSVIWASNIVLYGSYWVSLNQTIKS